MMALKEGKRKPQPEWMRNIREGDVLVSRTGFRRIVRRAVHFRSGDLYMVWMTIQRCSWTGRCYTVKTYNDLIFEGFTPAGYALTLTKDLDKRIADEFHKLDKGLTCCDVEGIA